jgi:hypothetical protein
MNKIKRLLYNIKNIFEWSKILWNNFDWDGAYLLRIIEYKLSRMKRYFENGEITTPETYQEMLDKINISLNACKQLTSREFELELLDVHYKKYPIRDDHWIEDINKPMTETQHAEWIEMNRLIDEKEKEYNHQLFDTIRDYHDWWWD